MNVPYDGSPGTCKPPQAFHANLIGAIGTPLDEDENLHTEGLTRHLDEFWSHGLRTVLIAGTMGCLPLLREKTYADLVRRSVELCTGRGEVFVGVGDAGFGRTRDRIEYLNRFRVDGVIVITPYFLPFSQDELTDYFRRLADMSRNPLYLYDIPARTGVKLELDMVTALAKHPNIRGIKCSCDFAWTRQLIERIGERFRIIVVALDKMDTLLEEGIAEHMDGLFAMMPHWAGQLVQAAERGDWPTVRQYTERFQHLLTVVRSMGSFAAYTALVRMRGIPGNFAPAPLRSLEAREIDLLRNDPVIHPSPTSP